MERRSALRGRKRATGSYAGDVESGSGRVPGTFVEAL